MATYVKVVPKDDLPQMWEEIFSIVFSLKKEKAIEEKAIEKKVLLISDVDGTLKEADKILCEIVSRLRRQSLISFVIATGRSYFERCYSTKNQGKGNLGQNSPLMITQGGSVIHVVIGEDEYWYIIPISKDMNELVNTVSEGLQIERSEVFRGEHLCIHFFDFERNREVISIPVARQDEEKMRRVLSKYDGNIVNACLDGALDWGYSIAIREYLDRGMPAEEIGVLYESEISSKVFTELTLVGADLTKCQKLFKERFGIDLRVQQQIADRYTGTRGCASERKPDIADVVEIGKKAHVDLIIELAKKFGWLIVGFGDQGNDDFLYSTSYSFVANAAPMGQPGGWNFAISMAEFAKETGHPVIHARHGEHGELINWAVEKVIAAGSFEKIKEVCEEMATSQLNLDLREWLLSQKP